MHSDTSTIYAEIKPVDTDEPMCLAKLSLDQPFKVEQRRCGLPVAAKAGGRVSPDGSGSPTRSRASSRSPCST